MPPPANPKSAPKPPKPVKLSREAATLAGGIYALAVAGELRERIPGDAKLVQLRDEALRAAKVFEPALLEAVEYFDDAAAGGEPDAGAPAAPVAPITTR